MCASGTRVKSIHRSEDRSCEVAKSRSREVAKLRSCGVGEATGEGFDSGSALAQPAGQTRISITPPKAARHGHQTPNQPKPNPRQTRKTPRTRHSEPINCNAKITMGYRYKPLITPLEPGPISPKTRVLTLQPRYRVVSVVTQCSTFERLVRRRFSRHMLEKRRLRSP